MVPQYTYVYGRNNNKPIELPEHPSGRDHLSECLLFIDPEMHCTCDDWSPEWTL
jgi:hypothetical protein